MFELLYIYIYTIYDNDTDNKFQSKRNDYLYYNNIY